MKKVTIIGAGVMGKIFLNALANAKANFFVTVVGHDKSKLSLQNEDLIIIAVKPQSFNELTGELKNKIDKNTVVLSIMAGINIQKIKNGLGVKKVMRAMPNLGAKVGKSMTVWTCAAGMSKKEKKLVDDVLRSIGKEMFVNSESVINKATAVSGSGPGFFYSLVESWLAAVESLGFTIELENWQNKNSLSRFYFSGEGGIRTLDTGLKPYNTLAVCRFRPTQPPLRKL